MLFLMQNAHKLEETSPVKLLKADLHVHCMFTSDHVINYISLDSGIETHVAMHQMYSEKAYYYSNWSDNYIFCVPVLFTLMCNVAWLEAGKCIHVKYSVAVSAWTNTLLNPDSIREMPHPSTNTDILKHAEQGCGE